MTRSFPANTTKHWNILTRQKENETQWPYHKSNQRIFKIRGREKTYEYKCPANFLLSEPNAPLGGGPGGLTFDPAEMKGMVKKGESSANDFIAALNPADITWA